MAAPFLAGLRRFGTARGLRLASGLVVSFFVATHLLNHALGLVSLETLEAGRVVFLAFWRGTPAGPILVASILVHIALAYHAIYQRRGWRMSPAEAIQLLLGIAIPPLLVIHVLGTAAASRLHGTDDTYAYVLLALWVHDPALAVRQAAMTLIVWGHACIGLHYWLRLKPWYLRVRPYLYAGALLLPVFSLLGFVSAGRSVAALNEEPGWRQALLTELNAPSPEDLATFLTVERWILTGLAAVLAAVLVARGVRHRGREPATPGTGPLSGRARGPDRARDDRPRSEPGERDPARVGVRGAQPLLDLPGAHPCGSGRASAPVAGGTPGA